MVLAYSVLWAEGIVSSTTSGRYCAAGGESWGRDEALCLREHDKQYRHGGIPRSLGGIIFLALMAMHAWSWHGVHLCVPAGWLVRARILLVLLRPLDSRGKVCRSQYLDVYIGTNREFNPRVW